MKKIISGKRYDTETATLIGTGTSGGLSSNDFRAFEESLYRTKKGQFFLHGEGGPMTRWSVSNGNTSSGGENIVLLSNSEAREWAEEFLSEQEITDAKVFDIEEG